MSEIWLHCTRSGCGYSRTVTNTYEAVIYGENHENKHPGHEVTWDFHEEETHVDE